MNNALFLLAQSTQDGELQKDMLTLCVGDWGSLNWLRPFVALVVMLLFCTPISRFGGLNLVQVLNLLAFPFWLNNRLNKR